MQGVAVSVLTVSGRMLVESTYPALEKQEKNWEEEGQGGNRTVAKESTRSLPAIFRLGISFELLSRQFQQACLQLVYM